MEGGGGGDVARCEALEEVGCVVAGEEEEAPGGEVGVGCGGGKVWKGGGEVAARGGTSWVVGAGDLGAEARGHCICGLEGGTSAVFVCFNTEVRRGSSLGESSRRR